MNPTVADEILGAAWARSDLIFSLLAPGAWHTRAIPLRHPPVFYLGHLAAFAWNHVETEKKTKRGRKGSTNGEMERQRIE